MLVSTVTALNDYNKEQQFAALSSLDADKKIKVTLAIYRLPSFLPDSSVFLTYTRYAPHSILFLHLMLSDSLLSGEA